MRSVSPNRNSASATIRISFPAGCASVSSLRSLLAAEPRSLSPTSRPRRSTCRSRRRSLTLLRRLASRAPYVDAADHPRLWRHRRDRRSCRGDVCGRIVKCGGVAENAARAAASLQSTPAGLYPAHRYTTGTAGNNRFRGLHAAPGKHSRWLRVSAALLHTRYDRCMTQPPLVPRDRLAPSPAGSMSGRGRAQCLARSSRCVA